MQGMPELCDHCKKIPLAGLACLTSSDIRTARRARLEANRIRRLLPLEQNDEDESDDRQKIPLGPLERIKSGATYCGVCRLIYGVISRQGAVYDSNKPIPTDQQAQFFAALDIEYGDLSQKSFGVGFRGSTH
jgi:hypothetical protein